MLVFALTAMEKLQRVPVEFWLKLVTIVSVFALTLVLIRSISQMNKVLLTVSIFLIVTILGFHWVYERNEPKFLTPVINRIAPFFPTKGPGGSW